MNETIKRRLAILEDKLLPSGVVLRVTLPDGRRADVPAREWWIHRYEWDWSFPRGDCVAKYDPNGWPVALLAFAYWFDKAARDEMASGNLAEHDRIMAERDDYLTKFFGEVIE